MRPRSPRSADATTLVAFFVVLQFGLPATLVLQYLPMSLTAATVLALVALPFVPVGVPVLIAALAAVVVGVKGGTTGGLADPPDPRTDGDPIP